MKHWEIEHAGELIRIEWNNAARFNLQTPVGGQWVDYHCFTCYGIDSDQEALEHAFEVLGVVDTSTALADANGEYCARMGHDT